MSYTINHYNGTLLATVADGTVDTSTDLTLIGKNYAGYGQAQNDNFVWLLENFANTTQPPNPLSGQIWFDSGNKKLKFWDGTNFRTTGGAELGTTAPTGLTQGDFWFNTASNQLYAYTGSGYTLIGPQEVVGAGTTQMLSTSVLDNSNNSHAIIEGISGGNTIFVISTDGPFLLNSSNPIPGFDMIQQGITLCYTENASNGVTTSSHRFWGTASNAQLLNGLPASSYVQAGNATFSTVVNFSDSGFTVGNPVAKLAIFNASQTTPTIQNTYGTQIQFETNVSGTTKVPLIVNGNDVTPGTSGVSNLGTINLQWSNIYAGYVYATAQKADTLNVGGSYVSASIASSPTTVVARDSNQNINANLFNGTATAAQYADLAEKYLADAEYEVGTVLMVGGEKEVTACQVGSYAVGPVSGNPAFMMNKDLDGGTYIALKGRVPVKVTGPIVKGQRLVAGPNGTAQLDMGSQQHFAIALESNNDAGVKIVECLVL